MLTGSASLRAQRWPILVTWCLALAGCAGAPPAPRIAAAANLNVALAEIEAAFVRDTGSTLEIIYGASGTLTRQILDGAPFELFLAADEAFPLRLQAAGLTADAGAVYAVGRLALFAPAGSPLRVDEELRGLRALLESNGVTRFAIANPEVAPYGRAAEATLRAHGLWDRLRPRLVLGDTVAQAAQFATTGDAVGGLLAYPVVLTPGFRSRGAHVVIPEEDHPPIHQRMVLLTRAGPVARRFYEYVQSGTARAILRRHGYGVPQ